MLQIICNRIANQLILYDIIKKEDQCIYEYGMYLVLMTTITTSTIIILGFLGGRIGLTIVFLLILASMRHYTGGYHANHYWQCYLLSCMSYCAVIYVAINNMMINKIILVLLGGGAMIYNLAIGSLNSDKNPKTSEEMVQRTKKARFIFVIYDVISIAGILFYQGDSTIFLIIIWSQIIVMFSLLISQIQRRYLRWKLKKQC